MPLTPEEIEARRFRLAQNGYDCEAVDRFLAEIAEALRVDPASDLPDPDEFGRLGQEIAAILRNARDSAGAVKAEAEGQAAALRSRAELEADDVRKAAFAEAAARRATVTAAMSRSPSRSAAVHDAETVRTAGRGRRRAEIRVEAERQLEVGAQTRPGPTSRPPPVQAGADARLAAKIERAEHDARRRAERDHRRGRTPAGRVPSARASSPPTCACWPPATTSSRPSTGWWPTSTATAPTASTRPSRRVRCVDLTTAARPPRCQPRPRAPARAADATTTSPPPEPTSSRWVRCSSTPMASAGDSILRMVPRRRSIGPLRMVPSRESGRAAEASASRLDREASAS